MSPNGPRATVFWDDRFRDYDFGNGHPFSETSRWLATRLLRADESSAPLAWASTVPIAPPELLERFHTPDHVARVRRYSGAGSRLPLDRGDTPSFPGCFEAASRLVGGTVEAFRAIRDPATPRALQPGGGLHHAHPGQASGFCVFNDLAVAFADALEAGALRRIAYVDIDVHQGDGVMYGFYRDGRLLVLDFHQDGRTIFPGTGEVTETGLGDGAGLKVNIPLPPGSGDEVFVPLFRRIVPERIRSFRPEAIVLQCGADGHVGDYLGGLQYTPSSYSTALAILRDLADEVCGGRLLVTGGGGYSHANVARVLATAGRLLAGGSPPDASELLPEPWRAEYLQAVGAPAPRTWGEHVPVRTEPAPARVVEELLGELASALGVRFPSE